MWLPVEVLCPRDAVVVERAASGAELAQRDPWELSPAQRIDALAALERQRHRIEARQQALLAVMAADPCDATGAVRAPQVLARHWVREEVACALRVSAVTAGDRLAVAVALTHRFPRMLALLRAAGTSLAHARALVEQAMVLADGPAVRVEQRVLAAAGAQTVAQFRRTVRRAVLAVDPRSAAQRHEQARAGRRVTLRQVDDGMAELYASLPAEQAQRLWAALTRAAQHCTRTAGGERCGVDRARADALVELVAGQGQVQPAGVRAGGAGAGRAVHAAGGGRAAR